VRRIRHPSQAPALRRRAGLGLAIFPVVGDWTADDRRMFAGLIAETMVHMVAELLGRRREREQLLSAPSTNCV
jgi:hypothetical protein